MVYHVEGTVDGKQRPIICFHHFLRSLINNMEIILRMWKEKEEREGFHFGLEELRTAKQPYPV